MQANTRKKHTKMQLHLAGVVAVIQLLKQDLVGCPCVPSEPGASAGSLGRSLPACSALPCSQLPVASGVQRAGARSSINASCSACPEWLS